MAGAKPGRSCPVSGHRAGHTRFERSRCGQKQVRPIESNGSKFAELSNRSNEGQLRHHPEHRPYVQLTSAAPFDRMVTRMRSAVADER